MSRAVFSHASSSSSESDSDAETQEEKLFTARIAAAQRSAAAAAAVLSRATAAAAPTQKQKKRKTETIATASDCSSVLLFNLLSEGDDETENLISLMVCRGGTGDPDCDAHGHDTPEDDFASGSEESVWELVQSMSPAVKQALLAFCRAA